MPEITDAELQSLKEQIETEKSKVQALLEEKEKLSKKVEEVEKENKELVLANTNLRSVNGKLLLQQESKDDTKPNEENEKSLEEKVLDILNNKGE